MPIKKDELKRDKARQRHLKTIYKLQEKIAGMTIGSKKWQRAMSKLETYLFQPTICDTEMGYNRIVIGRNRNG